MNRPAIPLSRNGKIIVLTLVCLFALALSAASASAEVRVKVVATPGELPEAFRPVGAAGDILISDGSSALIAGSSRSIRNELNMAAPDPFGLLLAFAWSGHPAGCGRSWVLSCGSPGRQLRCVWSRSD
jgi:hypothetical protein